MVTPIVGEIVTDPSGVDVLVVLADGGAAGDQALAAKTLQTLTPLFSNVIRDGKPVPGALQTGLSWATCVQLAHTFRDYWRPQPRLQAWLADQVTARTTRSSLTYAPPAGMTPYWWQAEGADLIAATGRALITDEPGVGKTASAILGIVEFWARNPDKGQKPTIVVCPASVVDSWVREWKMWAPHVHVVAYRGPKRTRLLPESRVRAAGGPQVYVTSYDIARMDAPEVSSMAPLLKLEAESLVIDEVHFVRNPTTARTRAVIRLAKVAQRAGGAVIGLSGTPITRDFGDLHPALQALDEHAWASKERAIDRYAWTIKGDYEEQILGLEPYHEPEFRMCLLGQHRRVAKADVLKDLPPKVYTTRTVELPVKWRKVYDDFQASMFAEMPDGTELSVMDAMSMYTHLSALSSAPGTVEVTYGPDVDEDTGEPKRHVHIELDPFDPQKPGASWKVAALMELLEERRGRQTIVCAPSRQLMDIAGAAAAKAGLKVGYVVGGQSAEARTADIDAFQARQLGAIFVTTQAGGVGITLTAADAVVFLQRPWALDESMQMEDRAHRVGADHESIQIIDIVASSTIDQRRREALRGKVRHLAEIVQDPRLVAELLGGKTVTEHPTTTSPRELIAS